MTKDVIAQAWRTALDPKGEWIPSVLAAADKRLTEVRRGVPDAGAMVIASNQTQARAYARILHGITGEIDVGGEIYAGMMPPWGGTLGDARRFVGDLTQYGLLAAGAAGRLVHHAYIRHAIAQPVHAAVARNRPPVLGKPCDV